MAETLRAMCRSAGSDLWIVDNAKHNQAPQIEPELYPAKLVSFFNSHLAAPDADTESGSTLTSIALSTGQAAYGR
jgi:hypothetical protein